MHKTREQLDRMFDELNDNLSWLIEVHHEGDGNFRELFAIEGHKIKAFAAPDDQVYVFKRLNDILVSLRLADQDGNPIYFDDDGKPIPNP